MGKFVERNLSKNEKIVQQCKPNALFLVPVWLKGILLCWLLLIPTIKAIIKTIEFSKIKLALTNKRVAGSVGFTSSKTMDIPLNKIQSVSVYKPFWGKVFNYSTIEITSAAGHFCYGGMKDGEAFKSAVMSQQDQFEEDRLREQATQMANAMAGALKNN